MNARINRLLEDIREELAVPPRRKIISEQDYKPLGDFRRANPKTAPPLFQRAEKAVKKYADGLATALNRLEDDKRDMVMALYAIQRDVKSWGGALPDQVAPLTVELYNAARGHEVDYKVLLPLLRKYLKSNELGFGVQRVKD